MRKLREVLRLRFELKLGYEQIGRSCSNRGGSGRQCANALVFLAADRTRLGDLETAVR